MKLWPFGKRKKRVFVLGLDGVPHSLMEQFISAGMMPNLAQLLSQQRLTRMDSCYPAVSNVAWSCFQTGLNPGGFGIFGFAELTKEMDLRVPNATDLKARTIWEMLSDAGKNVIGLGVPTTFPAKQVNGILVGGFLAPTLEKAVYPASLLPKLKEWGYRLDVDPMKARESVDFLRKDLMDCLRPRERAVQEFWADDWDLFVLHVMETDRINHFMWKYMREPQSQNGKFFHDFYRNIDDLIGTAATLCEDGTELMILSDHGFCETRKEVQLNTWLEQRGYLTYSGDPANGFGSVCGLSKAVALVPGRIHILTKGQWDRATVEPQDYEAVRSAIIKDLNEWVDEAAGQPICDKVFRREELFTGPYVAQAPDIVVHPRDGYDLKAALGRKELFGSSPINGMHTHHDAMMFIKDRPIEGPKPVIWDAAPTILRLLGVEAKGMQGRSLVE